MFELVSNWYKNKFSDPNSVTLLFIVLGLGAALYFFGPYILPVLVALVIAYLLEWPVSKIQMVIKSRVLATSFIIILFSSMLLMMALGLIPVLWHQLSNLLQEAPAMLEKGKVFLLHLPEQYPTLISSEQVKALVANTENKILEAGQVILSFSLTSIKDIVAWMIYLILVPLLVFFMLKDKKVLIKSISVLVPKDRRLIQQVWHEMDHQIMNYIRGKVLEILIIGTATFVAFWILDLRYAALLGALVGFSVLIPFVGAALVTIPVAAVAMFQFGLDTQFWTILIVYGIIQALDGNVLVPLLFSEAVDLNPVFIIVAVLFFGGLWGFWGVFFAIPMASLVKALFNAWSDSWKPQVQN
jgi:putative permease